MCYTGVDDERDVTDLRFKEQDERIDKKLKEQKHEIVQECTANMIALIESDITPKFNLLTDEIANIKAKMATKERVDELEMRTDDRFDILQATVKYHGIEISRLRLKD